MVHVITICVNSMTKNPLTQFQTLNLLKYWQQDQA